jgi:hypothetical protein
MAGYKFRGLDAQFLCDAVDLSISNSRTDGAAAVATVEAVEKLKSLFMQAVNCIIEYLSGQSFLLPSVLMKAFL